MKVSIVGSLRDREVACSASDRQGSNFESCVWRTVSSQSSHHPQEVLLAQFSLYVHKGGLKPDSFHFKVKVGSEQHILIKNFPILVTTDGPKTFVVGRRCGRHSHKLRNHAMNQFIVVAQEVVLDVVNV